jgi:prepilin-type N-terminal cleavage/methylation domain-containing protein
MMKMHSGMTLVELLVVIVIIGIMGAVSLRAIDVTRERANYDKTMKAMERLANAIVGDPDLVADGRRTDFGFVGDVGRLPTSLDELRSNLGHNLAWNGPYVRIPFTGDSTSFETDAWGQLFSYLPGPGTILSLANGRFPLTYQVTPDPNFLLENPVSGSVTDNQGNPPGEQAPTVHVHLWYADRFSGQQSYYDTAVGTDGSYAFIPPDRGLAVGNHLITAVWGNDSVSKWFAVEPRVGAVVDLRFGNARGGLLRLVTQSAVALMGANGTTPNNVTFQVVNTGTDSLALDGIQFYHSDPNAWCETLFVARRQQWNWIDDGHGFRAGGDTFHMGFTDQDTVAGGGLLRVDLNGFMTTQMPPDSAKDMRGDTLKLRFSDGSFVSLVPY